MKTYILHKWGDQKEVQGPQCTQKASFFLFCSEYRPKIKGEHPGLSIGDVAKKLGEMWNNTAVDDKQPMRRRLPSWRWSARRIFLPTELKEKSDAANKGVVKAQKSKKKKEEEDEKEDEGDEEEEEVKVEEDDE